MAFHESPRFPENIAYGAAGGPGFATDVVVTVSGRERRNGAWTYPRQRWDVSQGINAPADFAVLRAFFLAARGRLHGWRFKDWGDFQASHGDGVVTALTSTTFQMFKRYSSGAQSLDRIIYKPVAGTVEVRVSAVVDGTATVDTATGVITIASAPAPGDVTWSGEFDVPMRFDTDELVGRLAARNPAGQLLHQWDAIPIVETGPA